MNQALLVGGIKVSASGLAYGVLACVALVSDGYQFGLFGITLSAAHLASVLVLGGQNTAALKIWTKYAVRKRESTGDAFVRYGFCILASTACCFAVAIAVLVLVIPILDLRSPDVSLWTSFVFLTLALSLAEHVSTLLRVKGSVGLALIPRDIAWRVLAITFFLLAWWLNAEVSATEALAVLVFLLAAMITIQVFAARVNLTFSRSVVLGAIHKAYFRNMSVHLWAGSMLQQASMHIYTIAVGVLVDPISAGAFFAADRTARLVALAVLAFNQALGPQLSSLFYSGRVSRHELQALLNRISWISTLLASLAIIFFLVFGLNVLAFFDAEYASSEYLLVLMILALAQLACAYFGSAPLLVQVSGGHRKFTQFAGVSNLLGFTLLLVLVGWLGVLGAALGSAVGSVALATQAGMYCERKLNVTARPQLSR